MLFAALSGVIALIITVEAHSECASEFHSLYCQTIDYSVTLQSLIDEASHLNQSFVQLQSGLFSIDPLSSIVLREGISLKGDPQYPTILTVISPNKTATIRVPSGNSPWSIENIVFENVNILVHENKNMHQSTVHGNLFLNGDRGSVMAKDGQKLSVDGNIFLRDAIHAGTEKLPTKEGTNTGVLFESQKSSTVTNNIFGMDLRKMKELAPHITASMQLPFRFLQFIKDCLDRDLSDEQGYIASGVQLYMSNNITIKENIFNATFPDTKFISQDHGISVVGSNETYILQNFFAGWQLGDFGGAVRFTSAVDAYVLSNYLANTGIMMYAAVHADFMQVSNMVVSDNFLYRFLGKELDAPPPLNGWLYEGITFFDFYTARLNYTIRPPIWDKSSPLSPWGRQIVGSNNKFGAADGLDPNVISLGNLDPDEALFDSTNCYVTKPLVSGSSVVPLLWRQIFQTNTRTINDGQIPKAIVSHTSEQLAPYIPHSLRDLPIPSFWKAFTLRNDTIPMLSPETPCFSMKEPTILR
ncbi:hypothetical protein BDB01DRAFT_897012 [Pilobolus umbonatus]|nr:hypothetical protein BDB01DRAFT_897012 [Pilobolus umbonatus]